jgi:hypothetical protein
MVKVCFAKASTMPLGCLASIDLKCTITSEELAHWDINSINRYVDKFGDLQIQLDMAFLPKFGYPILKFRLLHSTGQTGFDVNTTPSFIYDAFLRDSFLLTNRPDPLLAYSNYVAAGGDPQMFLSQKGTVPIVITYNRPNEGLVPFLKAQRFSDTDAVINLKALINSVTLCDSLIVWSLAYGMNPIVLSVNTNKFIDEMKTKLTSHFIHIEEFESENKLPEW